MQDWPDRLLAAALIAGIVGGVLYMASFFTAWPTIWGASTDISSEEQAEIDKCLLVISDYNSGQFGTLDAADVRRCQDLLERSQPQAGQ
ncbi:MAG TPA: hypothetical protein VGN97_22105 [Mesorhizobium sp.]|jgi:hypothetical protein|nr:hypothetical protein [Mesorhizobium sp.]